MPVIVWRDLGFVDNNLELRNYFIFSAIDNIFVFGTLVLHVSCALRKDGTF